MFDQIRGTVIRRSPTVAVLDAGGIGYRLHISLSTYRAVALEGEEARLFVHLHVREDEMRLFGFAEEREREMFTMLLSAKGVGPTLAMTILSGCGLDDLQQAIADGDVALLKKIRGVGEKTAMRIVVELKGQMEKLAIPAAAGVPASLGGVAGDAVNALVSLDVPRAKARDAVRKALGSTPEGSVEDVIKEALKHA